MKSKCNKALSWLLTLAMLLTSFEGFSIPVLAAEGDPTVSVQAISASGFDDTGKNGATAEDALSVTVSVNDAVNVSFNSAVVSENGTVSADAAVSWNLVSANGVDAAELPAGLEKTVSGNVFTISGNVTASVNASYKLTASYNGATAKEIFFTIIAEDEEVIPDPAPVSTNKVTISANGFDDNGKDGSSAADAFSVTVSLNEAVNVSFNGAVVSANGAVSEDAVVSWDLVSGNGVDAAVLPAGFEKTVSGNVFTISGNASASVNETFKLTASFNGAESKEVFFTIIVEEEEETPAPVSVNKVTISANGFDDNGKTGSSAADALSVTVSVNEAVNVSFNGAVVSANGVVSEDAVVSWDLVSGNGVDAAVLPAGLTKTVSGNLFTISGNVSASVNETYKLTASFNGAESKDVFFTIIAEDKEETPVPASVNKIVVKADGFEDNSKGSSSADALSLTASLNEAIKVSFNAATVSANGETLSGNTVSFNLTNADGSKATLLNGLTTSENGNVFTVSGAVAASANGAYKLSVSCDGFDTVAVYFNITVEDKSQPEPGPVADTGITIEGLEESYPYTGAKIMPSFIVMDNDRGVQLAKGTDYTVVYGKNKKDSGSVTVKGKGNYEGKDVSATFAIVDPVKYAGISAHDLVGKVKSIGKISALEYDGTAKYPATITVKTGDGDIVMTHESDDKYTSSDANKTVILTFSNNTDKGTAIVAATGADGKTKKKTFKINAATLPTTGYTAEKAVFAVKGAQPAAITGEFNDKDLVAGQDFTVKYTNNKAVGKGTATLKGKGNFKGQATVEFEIEALTLDADSIAVNAVPGSKITAASVTVADGNGAKLSKKFLKVSCDNTGKLAKDNEINITVEGDGTNVTGSVVIPVKVGANKKAKVKVDKNYSVQYTGEPIDLEALEENPFKTGKISIDGLEYGTDYEVVTYLNNTKKGKMTVVLQGVSDKFTGTATAKVKIVAKKMEKSK